MNSKSNIPKPKSFIKNEEWFTAMIENSSSLIMRNLEDATITYVNKAVCKLFNHSPQEIIGQKWLTELTDLQKHKILESLDLAYKDLVPFKTVVPYILEDGSTKIVEWVTSPIYNNNGEFVGEYQGIGIDITDKVATENELHRKEDQLEIYFRQSLDGFFYMQGSEAIEWNDKVDKKEVLLKFMRDQRIIKVNQAFLNQYKAFETDIIGLTPSDIFAHDLENGTEIFKQVLEKEHLTIVADERKMDGSQMWVEGNYYLIKNDENKITGLFGIQRDITESKSIQDVLQKSEESYRRLFNTISDAIYIHDRNGKFIDVNRGAELMYGYTREEFIGKTPEFLSAPGKNDFRKILLAINKAFSESSPITLEFWGLRKNGEIFPKDVTINKGVYFGQEVLITIGRDISERKLSEELIKESEERFRNVYENSPIGIYRTTLDGKIILANPALLKMLGYSSFKEITSLNLEKDVFVQSFPRSEFIKKVKTERSIVGYESKWNRKDGTEVYIRENARAIYGEDGEFSYFEGTVEDITDKHLTEVALKKSEEKLRETNLTKDKFFSIIAHDLRSPFQGLLGIASILTEEDDLTLEERIDYETKLYQGLKTQFNLLDELLTWSRVQRGILEFQPSQNNLVSDIHEVHYLLKGNIEKKNQSMTFNTPDILNAVYDKNMIAAVIRNLLTNAIKFTDIGGAIAVSAMKKENEIVFSIKDSGIGIGAEDMTKLFRIDTQFIRRGTCDEGGTGLGLVLCKEFLDKHDGKIWIESEPGRGSIFNFSFPTNMSY